MKRLFAAPLTICGMTRAPFSEAVGGWWGGGGGVEPTGGAEFLEVPKASRKIFAPN